MLVEIAQIAATLSALPANQDKSPLDLAEQATALWQAASDLRRSRTELRILLDTAAKMYDEHNHFKRDQESRRTKGSPAITLAMWTERLCDYPGNRADLFFEFVWAEEVPGEILLKQLFPRADVSRLQKMRELLAFAGKGWATRFLHRLVSFCFSSEEEPENELLFSAIETGDFKKANQWLARHRKESDYSILVDLSLLNLIRTAKEDCCSCFSGSPSSVPLLLCRPLIDFRHLQMSRAKANAARGIKAPH